MVNRKRARRAHLAYSLAPKEVRSGLWRPLKLAGFIMIVLALCASIFMDKGNPGSVDGLTEIAGEITGSLSGEKLLSALPAQNPEASNAGSSQNNAKKGKDSSGVGEVPETSSDALEKRLR